ncbi:PREDICTED: C2 calcium-dependent domain-containing protein 4A-like [Poecilia mexicana]|uniref:C2 calcium-dependent domain-containing protein 4A-like n=1 Tax=Poecilia mexicana TaxID=48701 RepID=UPI00072E847C|nr:PREDICTED: C2 calcium-dependent domain-containing protein 4A-like [Poecilia mexicana]
MTVQLSTGTSARNWFVENCSDKMMKSGTSIRAVVLTPERIPTFIIPSAYQASPMFHRDSPTRSRLLLEDDDEDPTGTSPTRSSSWRRLRSPRACRHRVADMDPTTRAALSLLHVPKVTTSYGFRDVLATTPSTNRRESLFHHRRRVKVTVTAAAPKDPAEDSPTDGTGRSRVSLRPVKALGLKVMEELKKPAAALKALSPAALLK